MNCVQTLNGEEALALARTRKKDSDIQRGERQQEILKAIVKKATSISALTKSTEIMEAVGDNMTTNLKFSEIKSFVHYVSVDNGLNIENIQLKGSDYQPNGVYYYKLDDASVQEAKQILQSHLNLTTAAAPETESQSAPAEAGGTDSLSGTADDSNAP